MRRSCVSWFAFCWPRRIGLDTRAAPPQGIDRAQELTFGPPGALDCEYAMQAQVDLMGMATPWVAGCPSVRGSAGSNWATTWRSARARSATSISLGAPFVPLGQKATGAKGPVSGEPRTRTPLKAPDTSVHSNSSHASSVCSPEFPLRRSICPVTLPSLPEGAVPVETLATRFSDPLECRVPRTHQWLRLASGALPFELAETRLVLFDASAQKQKEPLRGVWIEDDAFG